MKRKPHEDPRCPCEACRNWYVIKPQKELEEQEDQLLALLASQALDAYEVDEEP